MKHQKPNRAFRVAFLSTLALLLLAAGCAEKDIKAPRDKFFAEWKTKAADSKGHSP